LKREGSPLCFFKKPVAPAGGALSMHHEEEGEIEGKGWRVGDEAAL